MSRIGYIRFKSRQPVDDLLAGCVSVLQKRHVRIAGAIQASPEECIDCSGALNLKDVEDGTIFNFSQDLGAGSEGCALDPQALAGISQRITDALERTPQLAVINRFGKAEADGHGLRSVIERAMLADIPLLVAVREDFEQDWSAFHGGMAERLPLDDAAVLAWCEDVIASSPSS
ncbi:DUF2478 domain-containing protein [Thalassospiraceae bacterium LMO-JJ14]|nr:DUF2478 domain-containing protein [Thalassospiraceae bacterium LMO-JJ14]